MTDLDVDAALALSKVAHELVPGVRHDFGLEAMPMLTEAGWRLVRVPAPRCTYVDADTTWARLRCHRDDNHDGEHSL